MARFVFTADERAKITTNFDAGFLEKLLRNLEFYAEKWSLEVLSVVDYFSVNCIFLCRSAEHGGAALKIGELFDVSNETKILREYDGGRFVRVLEADEPNNVILLERIVPGNRLREEQSLDARLIAFSELHRGLHKPPRDASEYPTYLEWVTRITKFMSTQTEHRELYTMMRRAEGICAELWVQYPQRLLLHGDLHHDNILLSADGYKTIDPKGVIGDPIFDVPRFIMNEFRGVVNEPFEVYREHIDKVARHLEQSLGIPRSAILQCVFIETAMAYSWTVESGGVPKVYKVRNAERMMDDAE